MASNFDARAWHRNALEERATKLKFEQNAQNAPAAAAGHLRVEFTYVYDHAAGLGPSRSESASFGPLKSLAGLDEISLADLSLGVGKVIENAYVVGSLVEQPFKAVSVNSVLEDDVEVDGTAVRICFYNCGQAAIARLRSAGSSSFLTEEDALLQLFAPGTQLCIRRPFFKVAADGHHALRVDRPEDVIFISPGDRERIPRRPRRRPAPTSAASSAATAAAFDVDPSDPASAAELNERGRTAYLEEKYVVAARWYKLAASRASESRDKAKYLSNRAQSLMRLQAFEEAYNAACKAVAADSSWTRAIIRQGDALCALGRYADAEEQYRKCKKRQLQLSEVESGELEKGLERCLAAVARSRWCKDGEQSFENLMAAQVQEFQTSPEKQAEMIRAVNEAMNSKNPSTKRMFGLYLKHFASLQEANFLLNGSHGRPRDPRKAAKLYREAAEAGVPQGAYQLAVILSGEHEGCGVPADHAEVGRLLEKAAGCDPWLAKPVLYQIGVVESWHALGVRYRDGMGCPVDLEKSFAWFRKSAESGLPSPVVTQSKVEMGNAFGYGRGVAADLETARVWFERAASDGYAPGQYELARMLLMGLGGPCDYVEARRLFRKAATQGHNKAAEALATMQSDSFEAFDVRLEAAKALTASAEMMFAVALSYLNGTDGAPVNKNEARSWFKKAANNGFAPAQLNLSVCFSEGIGGPASDDAAFFWMQKAAEQQFPEAEFRLAQMLFRGTGCEKDRKKASIWAKRAAKHGCKDAESFTEPDSFDDVEVMIKRLEAFEIESPPPAGMSMQACMLRMAAAQCKDEQQRSKVESLAELIERSNQRREHGYSPLNVNVYTTPETPFSIQYLEALAASGSETARQLLIPRRLWEEGVAMLRESPLQALEKIASAHQMEGLVCERSPQLHDFLDMVLKVILDHYPENVPALYLKGLFEASKRNFEFGLSMIDRAIRLRPNDPGLLASRANVSCMGPGDRGMEEGADFFTRAISLVDFGSAAGACNSGSGSGWCWADLFHQRGKCNCDRNARAAISDFLKYIELAAPDARHVAEAHYYLFSQYALELGDKDSALHHFDLAKLAEKQRLSVFKGEMSEVQSIAEHMAPQLRTRKGAAMLESMTRKHAAAARGRKSTGSTTAAPRTCDACGKPEADRKESPLLRCTQCKQRHYCDKECQRADWKTHKRDCKP